MISQIKASEVVTTSPPVVFAGHNTYLMSVTRLCRDQDDFTDVVFQCSDGQLTAHRLVVASASKFLCDLLLEHVSEDETPVIILPEVSKSNLNILLDFIYSGKMLVTSSGVLTLKPLVNALAIDPENVRLDDVTKPPIQTTVIDIASEFPIIASEHPVLQVRKIRRNSILVEQSQTVDFHPPIVNDAVKPADKKRTPKAKLKAVKPGQVKVIKSKLVQVKPEQIKPVKPVQIDRQTTKQEKKRRNSTDCPKPAKKSRLSLPAKIDSAQVPSPAIGKGLTRKRSKSSNKAESESVPSGFHDMSKKETWVCAICEFFDPPVDAVDPNQDLTDWIGCDCNRWYHKYCTKIKKFDDTFSCKTVKVKCLPTD